MAANALPRVPILALTATADPRVREDIIALLGMEDPEEVVTGFDRPNLSYAVRKTHLPARGAAPCGGCDVCDSRPGLGARLSLGRRALAALGVVFGTTRS